MLIIKKEQREFVKGKCFESPKGTTKIWKSIDNIEIGFLGEIVLCDYLGVPRPIMSSESKGDGGCDFEVGTMKVDIKVNPTNYKGNNGRFIVSKDVLSHSMTHFLILMYRNICFEIIGIISKEKLISIMKPCDHGRGDHKSFYCEYKDLDYFEVRGVK